MNLIQLRASLLKAAEGLREAADKATRLQEEERFDEVQLRRLKENIDTVLRALDTVLPPMIGEAMEAEIRRLSEPLFGWCSRCGAEWDARRNMPREPALRCRFCKAGEAARTETKPENPPRADLRENPLMEFLPFGD